MKNEFLKNKLSNAPTNPGCYLWKNKNNKIIYVGKAKNIKNRIKQYFNNPQNQKNSKLVEEIEDVDFIITQNENEALILENNLIKKHWPKYNILLKDSSEYPYILVTNEEHPRIIYTRNTKNKISGKYYGPLADSHFQKFKIYQLLLSVIPFRTCNKIPNKKCLRYDLKQCLGPCINKINKNDYQPWKKYINNFFHNSNKELLSIIKEKELKSAEMLDFEMAKNYMELYNGIKKIELLNITQITNDKESDYIAYYQHNNYLSIIIFKYVDKKLLNKHNEIIEINTSVDETISEFIMNYYDVNLVPEKIIISLNEDDLDFLNIKFNNKFFSPTENDKKILNLAIANAKQNLNQNILLTNTKRNTNKDCLEELSKLIDVNDLSRIEIFDNSNINFTNNVSSMCVFINGTEDKKLNRKYKLDNHITSDYEAMKILMKKRFKKQDSTLPNLIIMDGGIIQINAAKEVLKNLNLIIPIIGLSKNDKHQTNAIVLENGEVIQLDKKSKLYNFLWTMQESVHNSAIAYFRKMKINNDFVSILDNVPGLGKKRLDKINSIYKSINDLKNASLHELEQIIPKKVAIELLKKIK